MNQILTNSETQKYSILTSKLYIPPPKPNLVPRSRLTEKLNAGLNGALTLVSAPAGFGKSTLVSSWIHQTKLPAAWICLDEEESDIVQFLNYLVAALQTLDPGIGKNSEWMLQSAQLPPVDIILTNLVNEINHMPGRFILVLDDYHLIDTPQINEILSFLLEHLPSKIHTVIVSRSDPSLQIARIRGCNLLTELRIGDLRFTPDETIIFLNQVMNLGLSAQDILLLDSRTEGWVTGIQLAALSMQGQKDISSFIQSFAGDDRQIVDYLIEEVLNHQPAHVQDFLLKTSILGRLSESLCDFVTGVQGSRNMLELLEKTNLFIIPLDNKRMWYRYHHLFADLLKQRLHYAHGDSVDELHRRAGEWYGKNGFINESIDHALQATDYPRSAELIETVAESVWRRGEHNRLRHWLENLPHDEVISRPQLCILRAWYLFAFGQKDEAERFLHFVEKIIETKSEEPGRQSLAGRNVLIGRVATIRAYMAGAWGDTATIIPQAHKALEYLPENDLIWRSTAAIALGDALGLKGDTTGAYWVRLEASKACKAAGNIYFYIVVNGKLAINLRQRGRLKETAALCREQLQLAEKSGLSDMKVIGWILAIWGETLLELNDLDGAKEKLERGVDMAEQAKVLPMLSWSYMCLVRMLFSTGDLSGVERIIQRIENIDPKSDMPHWINIHKKIWQARIWLFQNNLAAAAAWVQRNGLDVNVKSEPPDEIDLFKLSAYLMAARIKIARGRLDEAAELLEHLLKRAEAGGQTTNMIEIWLLQALTRQAEGDSTRATEAVEQALALAEPCGFIRIFVDEGPRMAGLLEAARDTGTGRYKDYIKNLLSAFRLGKIIQTDNGPEERLSERELDVLRLIAAGFSNKKITEKLFISLSTVKTHLRNIYGKLNVNSRTEAIVKAKEFDLF